MDRGWLYTRLNPAGRPVPLVDARRTGGVPHASGIIGADEIQAVGRGVEPQRGPIARRERGGDIVGQIGRATSELQSLMRISYAVFCLKNKHKKGTPVQIEAINLRDR